MQNLHKHIICVMILISVFMLSACQDKEKINVVIMTFDTTRADHIGVYGKSNAMTPVIDELATDSVIYRHTLSPIPITLPSHSSIMTGKVPFTHGVRDNGIFILNEENLTLAEILKQNGYKTAAAIGAFPLVSQFGINQGFDYFNEHIIKNNSSVFSPDKLSKSHLSFDERSSSQVNDAIMPWIEKNYQSPFFVWLHYYDPHYPHNPPSPYDFSFINDKYQGEIAYSDESFGAIISQLKRLGQYDNTMIIFTSDHGEGNGEHGELTHLSLIYNSTLHVPLIIKYPNQQFAKNEVNKWVGLIDIFPTVLNTLNIVTDVEIQGKTLATDKELNASSREYYAETLSSRFSRGWGEQRSLVKNNYKYIHGPLKELYNLSDDPHELDNLNDVNPTLALEMKQGLQDYIDEHQVGGSSHVVNVSDETLSTLRGLGYIQMSGDDNLIIEEKLNDEGDAPQSHIKELSLYYDAKNMLLNGNVIEAKRLLDSLLADDPNNLLVIELKLLSEIQLGDLAAVKHTILNLPENSDGIMPQAKRSFYLAKFSLQEGNTSEAKNLLNQSEENKNSIDIQYLLAQIYQNENNINKYQEHLINVLAINSNLIDILNELGISYFEDNKYKLANETFLKAIKQNPYYQNSFYNYGIFLLRTGEFKSSITQLKRVIKLENYHLGARLAHIEALIKVDDIEQALKAINNLASIAPNSNHLKQAQQLLKDYET